MCPDFMLGDQYSAAPVCLEEKEKEKEKKGSFPRGEAQPSITPTVLVRIELASARMTDSYRGNPSSVRAASVGPISELLGT